MNSKSLSDAGAPPVCSPSQSIAAYINAKDGNRPHLLDAAFTPDATLRMIVRTEAIAFPPVSEGREAIAETLVRRFNQSYENVYTLCIGEPPVGAMCSFSCDWLVAMSEKEGGAVRLGCGRYDWSFAQNDHRANSLSITIEAMTRFAPEACARVIGWVSSLPYPWCSLQTLTEASRTIPEADKILQEWCRSGS